MKKKRKEEPTLIEKERECWTNEKEVGEEEEEEQRKNAIRMRE